MRTTKTLILIRPDGYIGDRCQPADGAGLKAYMSRYLVGKRSELALPTRNSVGFIRAAVAAGASAATGRRPHPPVP
jgi:hypothetical protein